MGPGKALFPVPHRKDICNPVVKQSNDCLGMIWNKEKIFILKYLHNISEH